MAVWQPPEEAAPAPESGLTAESIQTWATNYNFVDNGTASRDIMSEIVSKLENHSYKFGPTINNGYVLEITGPTVNQNFVVKEDQ